MQYLRQEYISHKSYIIDKIPDDIKDFRLPIKEGRYNTRLVKVDCFGNLLQTLKVYNKIKVNN